MPAGRFGALPDLVCRRFRRTISISRRCSGRRCTACSDISSAHLAPPIGPGPPSIPSGIARPSKSHCNPRHGQQIARGNLGRRWARKCSPRPSAIRTLRGWAHLGATEAVVIRECDEHGWMQDRADPHPREQALRIAQENPPFDVSPEQAIAAVRDLLGSIGHTCPECPPAWHSPRSADDQLVAMEIFFS
jgi:hypothetical protein